MNNEGYGGPEGNQGLFSHITVMVLVIKGNVELCILNKPPHNFNLLKMKLKTAMGNSFHLSFIIR